jgi:hypothetical protein
MKKQEIEKEVEKTLSLLDHVRPVKAGPFFYTRLESRMRTQQRAKKVERLLPDRWVLAMIGIAFLVLINVYSLLHFSSQSRAAMREQGLATIAEEYDFTNNQY